MRFEEEKFREYLQYDLLVRRGTEVYYLYWLKEFFKKAGTVTEKSWRKELNRFLHELKGQDVYQEWQGKQAEKAITLYFTGFCKDGPGDGSAADVQQPPTKKPDSSAALLDRFREELQKKKCPAKAEQIYLNWAELFLVYVEKNTGRQPDIRSNLKIFIRGFFTYLEVNRDASPAARKQAFAALELFFKMVFNLEISDIRRFLRFERDML